MTYIPAITQITTQLLTFIGAGVTPTPTTGKIGAQNTIVAVDIHDAKQAHIATP